MNIDNIIDYALSKPQNFPGKHNVPTCRTYKQQQPLEPKAQVRITLLKPLQRDPHTEIA